MERRTKAVIMCKLIIMVLLISLTVIVSHYHSMSYIAYIEASDGNMGMSINKSYEQCNAVEKKRLLRYHDVYNLMRNTGKENLVFYSTLDSIVDNGGIKNAHTKIVLSEGSVLNIFGGALLKGNVLNERMFSYGERVAVISEQLANDLYMTDKILGNNIYIDGCPYKILGIYNHENILWGGVERIFIPYKSYMDYEFIPVHTIILSDPVYKQLFHRTARFMNIIKRNSNVDVTKYRIIDFNDYGTTVYQQYRLIVFTTGFFAVIILLVELSKYIKFKYSKIISLLNEQYFSQIILHQKKAILKGIVFIILNVTCIFFIMKYIQFKLILPENIVSGLLSFHFETWGDTIRNILEQYGIFFLNDTIYQERLFFSAIRINAMLWISNFFLNGFAFCMILKLRNSINKEQI